MLIGASYSKLHLEQLGIDPLKAIEEFNSLGLRWLRTSLYWNDIEKQKGHFDFSYYDKLFSRCAELNINIILSVGAKAIRWPEFYFPDWVDKKEYKADLLNFIEVSTNHFKNYTNIKIWQVENEPLDPIWPSEQKIDLKLLKKEVDLFKVLDPNKVLLITVWGNELLERKNYKKIAKLADIIGLDLYLKRPDDGRYLPPSDSQKKIKQIIESLQDENRKVYISELQAEPWEEDELISQQRTPPSFTPYDLKINFSYTKSLNVDGVFFWGFEYWLWKRMNGDNRYWNEARSLLCSAEC